MRLIFKRSVLIEVYRSAHRVIENNFYLTHRTLSHTHPSMLATLKKLATHIQEKQPHKFQAGRTVKYEIQDVITDGLVRMFETTDLTNVQGDEDEVQVGGPTAEDIGVM